MLLRASSMGQKDQVDLSVVTNTENAANSGVPNAPELIAFADAAIKRDTGKLPAARDAVRDALGADALVVAAGVIGNFERMNRIADAAGIELDAPVRTLSSGIRDEIGINGFVSAKNTKPTGPIAKLVAWIAWPIAARVLPKRYD